MSKNSSKQLFEKAFGKYSECATKEGDKIYEIKLGGVKAHRRDFCYGGEADIRPANIVAIHNGKLYVIDVNRYGNFKEDPKAPFVYDQILSTFKFTN